MNVYDVRVTTQAQEQIRDIPTFQYKHKSKQSLIYLNIQSVYFALTRITSHFIYNLEDHEFEMFNHNMAYILAFNTMPLIYYTTFTPLFP